MLKICLAVSLACLGASVPDFGFVWLAFWRFVVGIAVAVIMIGALTIVTRHAPSDRLGRATGICFTGVGIGILLSGTLVPVLLGHGLAAAWTGIALLGAVAVGVGFWGLGAVPASLPQISQNPETEATGRPPVTPAVLCLIGGQTMFSLGLVPHTIYWVDYIVRGLGHDIGLGGFHWVLFGLGAISGTYLWGRLADRMGFRPGLVLVFTTLAAGIVLPVFEPAMWSLVFSSLVVGAQPGFSAIISGRTHQIVGPRHMAQVWRWMALTSGSSCDRRIRLCCVIRCLGRLHADLCARRRRDGFGRADLRCFRQDQSVRYLPTGDPCTYAIMHPEAKTLTITTTTPPIRLFCRSAACVRRDTKRRCA